MSTCEVFLVFFLLNLTTVEQIKAYLFFFSRGVIRISFRLISSAVSGNRGSCLRLRMLKKM